MTSRHDIYIHRYPSLYSQITMKFYFSHSCTIDWKIVLKKEQQCQQQLKLLDPET